MDNIYINSSIVILFLPLLAFIIQIFIGKRLPRQGDWVSISAILITLFLAAYMFISMLSQYDPNFKHESSFMWMDLGDFKIQLGFLPVMTAYAFLIKYRLNLTQERESTRFPFPWR